MPKTYSSVNTMLRDLDPKGADKVIDDMHDLAVQQNIKLAAALKPFAEFARGWHQQMLGSTVVKTGSIYAIENRAGEFAITVEHLMAARKVLIDQGWIEADPELPKGRLYYVCTTSDDGTWFVVRCQNAKIARKVGRGEFGYRPRIVRLATNKEIAEYKRFKGLIEDDQIEFTEDPSP